MPPHQRYETQTGSEAPSLKILQVVMGLDPFIGGPVSSLTTAVEAEVQHGHDVTVLCCAGDSSAHEGGSNWLDGMRRLQEAGARVIALRRARRPAAAAAKFGIAPQGPRWIVRHAHLFDVVHVRSVWGLLSLSALLGAKARGVPVVLTPHESLTSFDVGTSSSTALHLAKRALHPLVVRSADGIVLTSLQELRDSALSHHNRAVIIPHAVRMPEVDADRNLERPHQFTIGFLGRIHRKKNVHVAIDAVALDARLSLIIAGRGEEELVRSLRAHAAAHGVQDRVSWVEFISAESRPSFFGRIDVLAMPSTYENFGMAAAEAMAHGVPVVTTRTTGIAEVISQFGGGIVTDATGAAFRDAAIALAQGPTLMNSPADVARNHLSQQAYARGITALYRSLTSRTAR